MPAESLVHCCRDRESCSSSKSGKISERIVRSGAHVGNGIEIVEGLKEGELVAKSNLAALQQGREVSVR